jgi:GT2 family glycosyltransferase
MDYSIVIPTRDRPAHLAECIAALTKIEVAGVKWEVIIVDDGSEPPVSGQNLNEGPWQNLRFVRERGRGPASARNAGARAAIGGILIFIDDDCWPEPSLLNALRQVQETYPNALVGGKIINASPRSFWSSVTHLTTEAAYALQERRDRRPRRFSTSILAVPREAFLNLNGFDESFARPGGEDYELCERWQNCGLKATYSPNVIVHHNHPLVWKQFLRQQIAYGRGLTRCHAEGLRRKEHRSPVSSIRDVISIILYPFRVENFARGALLSGGVAISQILTAAGAARELLAASPPRSSEPLGNKS